MGINSYDKASMSLEGKIEELGIKTIFDRFLDSQPECSIGSQRLCCKFCSMGPCRITGDVERSICGADKHTIVMWNYARNVTAGVCQHAWHAYYYLDFLRQIAQGQTQFEIKGEDIARDIAEKFGIKGGSTKETIQSLIELFFEELTAPLGSQKRSSILEFLVPNELLELWEKCDVLPCSPTIEIIKTITRASIGVETDPAKLAFQTIRVGISDIINEYIVYITHNIIHGGFQLKESTANFGALEKEKVNILLQGHIPIMPSVIAELADDEELNQYAKDKGAKGINILGVCCTGNELFARYGIPLIGNFSQQELFIVTGAVDAYVVEQQCVLPTLVQMAENFHTLVFATDPLASIPGSEHMPVEFNRAYDQGRTIIKKAIDNFPNRSETDVLIPTQKHTINGSFGVDTFIQKVGGVDSIISALAEGTLQGIVTLGACNNPRIKHGYGIITVAKQLMKNDILIMTTGCAASSLATCGLMNKEILNSPDVGEGLKSFCQKHDIPPVLMFGSCVYNVSLLHFGAQLAEALKCTIQDLPFAASAPEWMNEKLFPISTYLLASGMLVHIGPPPPIMGSEKVISIFTTDIKNLFGGTLLIEPNPSKASEEIINYVTEKRKILADEKMAALV